MGSDLQIKMHSRWQRTYAGCLLCLICGPVCLAAQPPRLLVKNARLFTMAPQQRDPFTSYLLVAHDGTILTVGSGSPPLSLSARQVVDAEGKWVMPGFISAHSHLWQAAYRGIAADKTLLSWINDLYFQRAAKASPEDMYWFCLLGALDHLQNGITAVYNFNYARIYWQGDDNDFDRAEFRAEEKSGIRFIHGYEPGMIHPGVSISQARSRLSAFLDWIPTQGPSLDYLGVMLNGGTAFNNTYQQSVMEKVLMDEFSLSNQSHYLEPPEPSTQTEERAEFRWFADSGLLSHRLVFGHFIHADDSILTEAVKHGVSMTWNPLSNGRMVSGVADIPKYLKMGMSVGMGIDGEASGDLADPFENMRAGLYAVRDKYQDATVISPYQLIMLHTVTPAGATVPWTHAPQKSLVYLPFPYSSGGGSAGSFPEMYGWDICFINLGLFAHDRTDIVRWNILDQLFMIERFGKVLNGNRTFYETRGQPPLLAMSVDKYLEVKKDDDEVAMLAYPLLECEYVGYWNSPSHQTPIGLSTCRDSGSGLSGDPERAAECEAGLDFTPIFGGHIQDCVPIHINCALVRMAQTLGGLAARFGWHDKAAKWQKEAETRAELINRYCWDEKEGCLLRIQLR